MSGAIRAIPRGLPGRAGRLTHLLRRISEEGRGSGQSPEVFKLLSSASVAGPRGPLAGRLDSSPSVGRLLLRPEQAAEALSIGRTAVFELMRSGRLRSIKVGGRRRIPAAALTEFVRQLEEEQAA